MMPTYMLWDFGSRAKIPIYYFYDLIKIVICPKDKYRKKILDKSYEQFLLETDIISIVKVLRSFDVQLKCLFNK